MAPDGRLSAKQMSWVSTDAGYPVTSAVGALWRELVGMAFILKVDRTGGAGRECHASQALF